ncbi:MAG: N-6 DNA methylase [Planctomycetaceae bacterium]
MKRLRLDGRYGQVSTVKAAGATYTPTELADFVAARIVEAVKPSQRDSVVRILDPAVGEGELLVSLLQRIPAHCRAEVHGFDTDEKTLEHCAHNLRTKFPGAEIHLTSGDFLESILEERARIAPGGLFSAEITDGYDLVIANPPYVRTQILGASEARRIAERFRLTGRVDLCHAFIIGMATVLRPGGIAGIIVSNRFMTTRAGASVRRAIRERLHLRHVWDLGDTKLFDAAVLPAVLLAEGRNGQSGEDPRFTSIYETAEPPQHVAGSIAEGIGLAGVVQVPGGRRFRVRHGTLDASGGRSGVWRIATAEGDQWLSAVTAHTWRTFRDIGKVRVGVKTCADKVFIRPDWDDLPDGDQPELLRPLATHHIARRFRAATSQERRRILYPHECRHGKRYAVDLAAYPKSRKYLERHRETLESRTYVLDAGREWYEIWVPQDPELWAKPKLIFRDISEEPCFWLDREGSIVNGDCYWLCCESPEDEPLLWLALAVANSKFVEVFYDHKFHNKLYSGRRRYITQYVEQFPLPDPKTRGGRRLAELAQTMHSSNDARLDESLSRELNALVWQAFGLPVEEVAR